MIFSSVDLVKISKNNFFFLFDRITNRKNDYHHDPDFGVFGKNIISFLFMKLLFIKQFKIFV